MNKIKYYFTALITILTLFSCSKDEVAQIPLRDFKTQYNAEIANIETYLKTYYISSIVNTPNEQDVTFEKIPDGGTEAPIYSLLNSPTYPKLLSKDVDLHGVTYKLYYLLLREGTGDSPCNVDNVLTAYRGDYISTTTSNDVTTLTGTTFFEEQKNPQAMFNLSNTITGWGEIFPKLKTGSSTTNNDGIVSYQDFGAAVVFIPSGLGYYNNGTSKIPAYTSLIFKIKLYAISRFDTDNDGVPSYKEDINGDGFVRDYRNTTLYPNAPTNPDDTDGDKIPDFIDIDDDGDFYSTILEITKPAGTAGNSKTYPFDPIIDNPDTTVNETELEGIPSCSGDKTTPTRLRKHLDKNCH
jgi:hypothetical protein